MINTWWGCILLLYFIGLGLNPKALTLEAIEVLEKIDKVIIDKYTSIIPGFDPFIIKKYCSCEIVFARREMLEGRGVDEIVEEASTKDIAILVPGDPFIATTHDIIRIEALKRGIKVRVIHNASIYSVAASATGLQMYRFGKTVTVVYPDSFKPYSVVETIYDNLSRGLHTLLLLDLRVDEERFMNIKEAVDILLDLDSERRLSRVIGVGLARVGSSDEYLQADLLPRLKNYNYPPPPHSIIIVAKPHPVELESLYYVCNLPYKLYIEYSSRRIQYP